MKTIISLFLLFVSIAGWGQASIARPQLLNAEGTMLTSTYSAGTISGQVANWQKQTKDAPGNANGWFNYYLWTERDKGIDFSRKSLLLAGIVSDAGKHIPQSSEYSLMRYLQSGRKDSASLFKAIELSADKPSIYPYAVQYGIINGDPSTIALYTSLLEADKPLSLSLYTYHYNVLMSADSNAAIYGRGLYDMVPLAILQYVYNIRKDITLQYYSDKVANSSSNYLCLSLGQEVLSQYRNASYTGLLVKLADPGINELTKHFEKDMDLRFLETDGYWKNDEAQLFRNYLPSFILLYRHYRDNKMPESDKLLSYIQKIAGRVHEEEKIKQLLEK